MKAHFVLQIMRREHAHGLWLFGLILWISLSAPSVWANCSADFKKCQEDQKAAHSACTSSSNPGSAGTQVGAAPQSGTGNASNQCNTANGNFQNQASGLDGYANFCDAARTKCSEACARSQQSCQSEASKPPQQRNPPDAAQLAQQAGQAKQFCEADLGALSQKVRDAANNARQNAGTSAECRGGQSAAQQPNNSPQNQNERGGGGGGGPMPMPMPMPQNQDDKDKGKNSPQQIADTSPKTSPTPLNGYMPPGTSPVPSNAEFRYDGSGNVQIATTDGQGGGAGLSTGGARGTAQDGRVQATGAASGSSVSTFQGDASGGGGSGAGGVGGSAGPGFNFSLPQLQNAKSRFEDRNVSGMAIKAEDGITSSNGPSLFEKVTGQYQSQLRRGGFIEGGSGAGFGPGSGSSLPEAAPPAPYTSGGRGSAD